MELYLYFLTPSWRVKRQLRLPRLKRLDHYSRISCSPVGMLDVICRAGLNLSAVLQLDVDPETQDTDTVEVERPVGSAAVDVFGTDITYMPTSTCPFALSLL